METTIKISGEITGETLRGFRRRLDAAKGEDLLVEIDSPGGNFIAGLGLYNEIKAWPRQTTARVIYAGSAATLPMCACDKAVLTAKGTVLIHLPTVATVKDVGLDVGDLRKLIDNLEVTTNVIGGVYTEKAGWNIEFWRNQMKRGITWGPGPCGQAGGLIDRTESDGPRRPSNGERQEALPLLGEVAVGALKAGLDIGAKMAATAIAGNGSRPYRWRHSDGSAFGGPFDNQLGNDA
jgi:ATP-dependent protease ClpP protease subunit